MLVLSPPQNVSGDFRIFRDFIPSIWFYCPYHHCKKELTLLTLLTCTLLARIQYTTTRSVELLEFMVAPFFVWILWVSSWEFQSPMNHETVFIHYTYSITFLLTFKTLTTAFISIFKIRFYNHFFIKSRKCRFKEQRKCLNL